MAGMAGRYDNPMPELTLSPQSGIYEFGFEHLKRNCALSAVLSLYSMSHLSAIFGGRISMRVLAASFLIELFFIGPLIRINIVSKRNPVFKRVINAL